MLTQAKFSLGQVVATPGALAALEEAGQRPPHFLELHASGAWETSIVKTARRTNRRSPTRMILSGGGAYG